MRSFGAILWHSVRWSLFRHGHRRTTSTRRVSANLQRLIQTQMPRSLERQQFRTLNSPYIPDTMVPPRRGSANHLIVRQRSVDHLYGSSDSSEDGQVPSTPAQRRPSPCFSTIFDASNYTLAIFDPSQSEVPSRAPSIAPQPTDTQNPSPRNYATSRATSVQRSSPSSHAQQVPRDDACDMYAPPTTAERWRTLERAMQRPERAASVERGRRSARMRTFQPSWIVNELRRIRSRDNLLGLRNSHLLRRDEPDVFRDDAAIDSFVADLWEDMARRHA